MLNSRVPPIASLLRAGRLAGVGGKQFLCFGNKWLGLNSRILVLLKKESMNDRSLTHTHSPSLHKLILLYKHTHEHKHTCIPYTHMPHKHTDTTHTPHIHHALTMISPHIFMSHTLLTQTFLPHSSPTSQLRLNTIMRKKEPSGAVSLWPVVKKDEGCPRLNRGVKNDKQTSKQD